MVVHIKDPIYGQMPIPDEVMEFVDQPEFQRLRFIKQLGLVFYVFPSAVHTRFEHSLGVAHLSGVMVDQLVKEGANITPRERILVMIAGLLHDIGHVAGSHLIDYMLIDEGKETHEQRALGILDVMTARMGTLSPREVGMIKDMIMGNIRKDKPFLYQLICNKKCGVDADRLDYLQRDAYHTKIPGFQPDYLILCATIDKDGNLAFKSKAIADIRSMFRKRQEMFTVVYRHHTVLDIEDVYKSAIHELKIIENWEKSDPIKLDDVELEHRLRKTGKLDCIYRRSWERNDGKEIFRHCETIDDKSIEREIQKVSIV